MPFRSKNTPKDTSYVGNIDESKTGHKITTMHCAPLHSEQSEISIEKTPNHIFLLRKEVESEIYLRETRPFIIESAKTYV